MLPARALGLGAPTPHMMRALSRPDGLRTLILQSAFGLPVKPTQSISKVRAELAVIALERAFGNRLKSQLRTSGGLNAKAGRLLAAQLSRRVQDHGSDGRLVAALAAEQVGAAQSDYDTVKLALLRGWLSRELDGGAKPRSSPATAAPAPAARPEPQALPRAANDLSPLTGLPELPAARPDMAAFVVEVKAAARARAEGWPGNRKAFISQVWQQLKADRPDWGVSEIEFKVMLTEAHRGGHVVLATADLKDKRAMAELEQSAVRYKNTVWHFVRVED
jgi:hypothetical protein